MNYTAALVGCGRIGFSLGLDKKREQPASHTMALNDNSHIKLIAGCDTDELTLAKWQEYNRRALVYSDSANLYARMNPDIVVIAVNEKSHLKEAVAAINSKPRLVILEKPVALNMDQALKIKHQAELCEVPVLVNHERRFADDFLIAKKYMGKIGALQSIKATLSSSMVVYNSKEENSGAYSLIHDGTHLVDAVLYFLEDDQCSSLEEKKIPNYEKSPFQGAKGGLLQRALNVSGTTPDTKTVYVNSLLKNPVITGIYRDENNSIRQLSAHYSCQKCPDVTVTFNGRSRYFGFEIQMDGTLGRICIGNGYMKFYSRQNSELYTGFYSLVSDKSVRCPKYTRYFSNMVKNSVEFLNGKSQLKSTLDTGINALAVLEEIKRHL